VTLGRGGRLTGPLQAQLDLVQSDDHILQPVVTHTCTHACLDLMIVVVQNPGLANRHQV